ncbi:hypothetical protein [Streptomyces sp. NPDC048187]|uniref:hypothetical protein n=1 Tax=Streptomyces sp. NPDC048187 TaxID=3365509 RepID=UPI0037227A91
MNCLEGGHMFQRATARTALPFLVAVLVALQFFAPSASFAFAHTSRDAMANAQSGATPTAQSGVTPSGPAAHEERAGCHDPGRSVHPHGPARVRDRHRTTAVPQPEPPERSLADRDAPAAGTSLTLGEAAHQGSRPATDRSPEALQVFRC